MKSLAFFQRNFVGHRLGTYFADVDVNICAWDEISRKMETKISKQITLEKMEDENVEKINVRNMEESNLENPTKKRRIE